jgi:DNA-binding transcriptional LysR family regulator
VVAVSFTTQPALSAQIRELETALGVRLFDRNTRSVSLTVTGRDMLPAVEQVMSGVSRVVSYANDIAARKTGRVAVAALPSIASNFFPGMIGRYCEEHPKVAVTLRDELAEGVVGRVREGAVDFGISNGPFLKDTTLIFEPLGTDRMFAVLPQGHPLARLPRLGISHLMETPLILMNRYSSVRMIVDRAIAALGHVVTPTHETSIMSTAISLVRAGLGITVLPGSATGSAELIDLVVRPIDEPALARPLGMVRHAGRSLSPAAELFAARTRVEFIAWLAHSHSLSMESPTLRKEKGRGRGKLPSLKARKE